MVIHPLLLMDKLVDSSRRGCWFPWFPCRIFVAHTTGNRFNGCLLGVDTIRTIDLGTVDEFVHPQLWMDGHGIEGSLWKWVEEGVYRTQAEMAERCNGAEHSLKKHWAHGVKRG
jgi:hypothetical protein